MSTIVNVHRRVFAAPLVALRPWLEAAWSNTDRDVFPRDVIPSWRKNPAGHDALALVPGETRIGHGPFRFRLTEWDGTSWRVAIETPGFGGWHGFVCRELPGKQPQVELTHTLTIETDPLRALGWHVAMGPIHDWVVEVVFDRLAAALATGVVPTRSVRPMPWRSRVPLVALRAKARLTRSALRSRR